MKGKLESYWNEIYDQAEIEDLGWYEDVSGPSIEMILKTDIRKDGKILVVGAGASRLWIGLLKKISMLLPMTLARMH